MTSRSHVAGILLIALIVACAVQEKAPAPQGARAIADAYVRAWNQHDTAALDTLLAPDATHEDLAQNFSGKGPAAVVAFMRREIAVQPDFNWHVTNTIEDGGFVALEWTWASTYTGQDPSGRKVTKKHIAGRGSSVAEIQNGKIKRFTDYYDGTSFFR